MLSSSLSNISFTIRVHLNWLRFYYDLSALQNRPIHVKHDGFYKIERLYKRKRIVFSEYIQNSFEYTEHISIIVLNKRTIRITKWTMIYKWIMIKIYTRSVQKIQDWIFSRHTSCFIHRRLVKFLVISFLCKCTLDLADYHYSVLRTRLSKFLVYYKSNCEIKRTMINII